MKTHIDLAFLRTVLSVRLTVAPRTIFRDLWQHKGALLREQRREELVAFLTQGWDSYGLEGEADAYKARHSVPPTGPLIESTPTASTSSPCATSTSSSPRDPK